MSSFDFLNPKLCPKVSCKWPCTEGHEVENLISDKECEKKRGFMTFYAVTPPVYLDFTFICTVDIHCIVLNTTVNTLNSNGIKLFVKNDNMDEYFEVGRCKFDTPGVIFYRAPIYLSLAKSFNKPFQIESFKPGSKCLKALSNVTTLRVHIFFTKGCHCPCLGSIEVWANVSKTCSQRTRETIAKIIEKTRSNPLPLKSPRSPPLAEKGFAIPEDFRDDLTNEVMTMPMTLPSGKTVDQSTLEKHSSNEASFGRRPCDPFTGLKFSDTLKPVFNARLKNRIDMFITENSFRKEFANISRTVGGASTSRNYLPLPEHNDIINLDSDSEEEVTLEEAISNAKRCKNYISFNKEKQNVNICINCKENFQNLYVIPCNHLHCRECLLTIVGQLKCSKCGGKFHQKDVKRLNL